MSKLLSRNPASPLFEEENAAPVPVPFSVALTPVTRGELAGQDAGAETSGPRGLAGFFGRYGLFTGIVALPCIVAGLFFGLIAAGQYASETKFIVRSASSGGDSVLSMLGQAPGLSRAADETHAVGAFIRSRDMAAELEKDGILRPILAREEADFITRFPNVYSRDNAESLFKAYLRKVDVDVDTSSGITTMRVFAYRPDDAQELSRRIIERSEAFINRLNVRAHKDAISYAEMLVRESTDRLAQTERRLAEYRNREMIIDPAKESAASLETLAKISTEISRMEAGLAQQIAQTPDNPTIGSSRERVRTLRNELEKLRRSVAGDERSIASKLEGFERLSLEREFAAKGLGAALIELEKARQFAQTQRIYLQTIVASNSADTPAYPLRLLMIALVAGIALTIFWTIKSLIDIILEHQA
jgi:capsular polysaccharide transport system permease protein